MCLCLRKLGGLIVAIMLIPIALSNAEGDELSDQTVALNGENAPLVSNIRQFTHEANRNMFFARNGFRQPAIEYVPDDPGVIFNEQTYSNYLKKTFERVTRNSGFAPLSSTKSNSTIEVLLWCNGTSRDDYLYGQRAAHIVVGQKTGNIKATARERIDFSDALNFEVEPISASIDSATFRANIEQELWDKFFESGPTIYDATLPAAQDSCVVEAKNSDKRVVLWRARYHNDPASQVIDALWALVNETLPAAKVTQFFPSPIFYPDTDLKTPAGTYRMSEVEKLSWHNKWDALFTKRIRNYSESPIHSMDTKVPVFRWFVAGAWGSNELLTIKFNKNGNSDATLKRVESESCTEELNPISTAYIIRKFSVPKNLSAQVYTLLLSNDFATAAGDEQKFGYDGAEYFFELLTPDGKYTARKRWSPDDNVFDEMNDVIYDIIDSSAAKADSAVVLRDPRQNCPNLPE
jgi:hypothetical protein